jgi:hypothetical protein
VNEILIEKYCAAGVVTEKAKGCGPRDGVKPASKLTFEKLRPGCPACRLPPVSVLIAAVGLVPHELALGTLSFSPCPDAGGPNITARAS